MMYKIFSSLLMITVVSVAVVGSTSAFFTDTETSTDNVIQAGAIDLQIGNHSYYNKTLQANSTWALDNITNQLFFNLNDVKPQDMGESTIDLKVLDNNAWACMNTTLSENDDTTCTDPELADDPTCTVNANLQDGDLASNLNMILWADDGDNVLEIGESVIASGSADMMLNQTVALADSTTNQFGTVGQPLTGAQTYHLGQGWCMGTLTPAPIAPGVNDPTVNAGFTCNGAAVNNAAQTDVLKANISFTTVQSRNNPNYTCVPQS